MRIFICVIMMLFFIALETSVAVNIAIANITPSFFILILTVFLIWVEDLGVYVAAVFGGLILDIVSGSPLGMNALRYLLTTALLSQIFTKRNSDYPFIPMVIAFLGVIFSEIMIGIGFYVLQEPLLFDIEAILQKAVYTAIGMLLLFWLFKKLFSIEWMNKKVHFEMTLIHTKK